MTSPSDPREPIPARGKKGRDPHTLSIAEMTRSLERCTPVLRALERAEVTPREAAIAFASLLRTGQQVAIRAAWQP